MFEYSSLIAIGLAALAAIILILAALGLVGCRYIPHNRVGVIEKLWSPKGSLKEGRIVASHEEAGFQTRLLRGGLHFGFYPFQFAVHKQPLITVAEGRSPIYTLETASRSATASRTLLLFSRTAVNAAANVPLCAKASMQLTQRFSW
jgi:hypothetical protein